MPKLPQGLSPEQKTASALLLFLGLGGMVIGFLSFGANLRRPFETQLANAPKGFQTDSQKEAADVAAAKKRDTDKDGLVDYDESNVYKTSPYLADTDSDGINDKEEVFAGTDPNCPKGRSCAAAAAPTTDTAAPTGGTALEEPKAPADDFVLATTASAGGFASEAEIVAYLKALSVEQQKNLLLQAGLAADKLNGLTDQQIKDLFGKTVDASAAQGQFKALVRTQTNP